MSVPTLKSSLRIQAFLRRCDLFLIPAAVVKRGDSDAGDIVIKQRTRDGRVCLWRQQAGEDRGARRWVCSDPSDDEHAVDVRLGRAADRDEDLWIIEVEAAELLPSDLP